MATLTSTGVNCSNGTLDGFYTGSTAGNTTYPIGSYLFASGSSSYPPPNATYANATFSMHNSGTSFNTYASGSALAGTWRCRGVAYQYVPAAGCTGQYNYAAYLAQRTA